MSDKIQTGELSSKSIDIKTRRSVTMHVSDVKKETLKVFYDLETYYMDGINEVIISSEPLFYLADYNQWKNSDEGQAIEAAILTELSKDNPGE